MLTQNLVRWIKETSPDAKKGPLGSFHFGSEKRWKSKEELAIRINAWDFVREGSVSLFACSDTLLEKTCHRIVDIDGG